MSAATTILAVSLLVTSAAATAAEPASQDQTKYCLQLEASTGSHINRTECRTKAEWAQLGIDIDEVIKK